MIDTDKYKGHSKTIKTGCWKRSAIIGFKSESVFDESGRQIASVKLAGYDTKRVKETYANLLLITDAPKLLAEVKRLQAWKNEMTDIINEAKNKVNTDDSRPREIWWNLQYKLKEMIE